MKSNPSSVPSESVLSFRMRLLGRSALPDITSFGSGLWIGMRTAGLSVRCLQFDVTQLRFAYPRVQRNLSDVGYQLHPRHEHERATDRWNIEWVNTCDLQNLKVADS